MNQGQPEWKTLTKPTTVNVTLSRRNNRHLQQTSYEVGIDTKVSLTTLRENSGLNEMSAKARRGEQVEKFEATQDMLAWFRGFNQTDQEKEEYIPKVGWITSVGFQAMFNVAREAISSTSQSPEYTLWKCGAKSDYISSIMSMILSLLFVCGFENTKWVKMTNFIPRKKPGRDVIPREIRWD